jgi:hypothetical protein
MVIVGGLLASGGGLFGLGIFLVERTGLQARASFGAVVLAAMLLAVVPLTCGVALFLTGIRRMNQHAPVSVVRAARS